MIHIYTQSHCALCLSLNFTFPQIVYISHVKEGEITFLLTAWSLYYWDLHVYKDGATFISQIFFIAGVFGQTGTGHTNCACWTKEITIWRVSEY